MKVRNAITKDLPDILEIYNQAVLFTTASYDYDAHTLEMREIWFNDKINHGFPVFVIEDADGVVGFGTYGNFRDKIGYQFTVEHSIYITETKRGRGYGTILMTALIESAISQNKHVMIAGIDALNTGSIIFHKKFGFEEVAHFKEVGKKFDQWLDVIFMQKIL